MIQIQNYLPLVYKIIFLIIFLAKYKDIKDFVISMLSDDSKVSSKRVIAISGMATFIYLVIYVTKHDKHLDANIIIALVTIILTAAAIATMPQLVQLFSYIKGKVPGGEPADDPTKITTTTQTEIQP